MISEETSIRRLTRPSIQMPLGIWRRVLVEAVLAIVLPHGGGVSHACRDRGIAACLAVALLMRARSTEEREAYIYMLILDQHLSSVLPDGAMHRNAEVAGPRDPTRRGTLNIIGSRQAAQAKNALWGYRAMGQEINRNARYLVIILWRPSDATKVSDEMTTFHDRNRALPSNKREAMATDQWPLIERSNGNAG
uniref:hypothetical protein n=1 Tax=Cupriavidus necator TaxID=106590 RepID=UPI003F494627